MVVPPVVVTVTLRAPSGGGRGDGERSGDLSRAHYGDVADRDVRPWRPYGRAGQEVRAGEGDRDGGALGAAEGAMAVSVGAAALTVKTTGRGRAAGGGDGDVASARGGGGGNRERGGDLGGADDVTLLTVTPVDGDRDGRAGQEIRCR